MLRYKETVDFSGSPTDLRNANDRLISLIMTKYVVPLMASYPASKFNINYATNIEDVRGGHYKRLVGVLEVDNFEDIIINNIYDLDWNISKEYKQAFENALQEDLIEFILNGGAKNE